MFRIENSCFEVHALCSHCHCSFMCIFMLIFDVPEIVEPGLIMQGTPRHESLPKEPIRMAYAYYGLRERSHNIGEIDDKIKGNNKNIHKEQFFCD